MAFGTPKPTSQRPSTQTCISSRRWVADLIFCSLTTTCICIFGILFRSRSLALDRFDAVLGHTFDNPDFGLDSGGITLDVDERLCLLDQLAVRVVDVRKFWDIERIGFTMKDNVAPL
ncbi:hypothetical protein F4779DRAFT_639551 [Xylariaceae sp. FL0662B]|nr:hypothetical protein F4779DRAFT_639551 [Xylariaceae sp. FL0662B]